LKARLATLTGAIVMSLCAPAAAEDAPFVSWADLLPPLTSATFAPTSEDDCTAGRIQCVDKVIRVMTRHFDQLAARCDHNTIFALSYLRTTQEYHRAATTPGFFEDPAFVNHEDAVFARYYFDAYDAWAAGNRAAVPEAWLIALDAGRDRKVKASTNLSLGINAHVNRDLPYVLAGIGLVKPDGTSRKRDHDKVNEFLNKVTDGLFAEAARRFDPTMDDDNVPGTMADDVALFQLIASWRETAWRNAERLVNASDSGARAQVAREIEAYAASVARNLRDSGAYSPLSSSSAAQRDAYCAQHWDDA
jgi:hypothetical protein